MTWHSNEKSTMQGHVMKVLHELEDEAKSEIQDYDIKTDTSESESTS